MDNPRLRLVSLKVTEDYVEAIFIDREEYLQQLDSDIDRLKAEQHLREQELEARIATQYLSTSEQQVLLAAQLHAMEEAHRREMDKLIQERMSKVQTDNEAGRLAVEMIRRKAEELKQEGLRKMQEIQEQHAAAMAQLDRQKEAVLAQGREAYEEVARQRERWKLEEDAGQRKYEAEASSARAEAGQRRAAAIKRAEDEEREANLRYERDKSERKAAHRKKIEEQQERLRQLQAQAVWNPSSYIDDEFTSQPPVSTGKLDSEPYSDLRQVPPEQSQPPFFTDQRPAVPDQRSMYSSRPSAPYQSSMSSEQPRSKPKQFTSDFQIPTEKGFPRAAFDSQRPVEQLPMNPKHPNAFSQPSFPSRYPNPTSEQYALLEGNRGLPPHRTGSYGEFNYQRAEEQNRQHQKHLDFFK